MTIGRTPKFDVGDKVVHTNGYNAAIGTVVAVIVLVEDFNRYHDNNYRYTVEWPKPPHSAYWRRMGRFTSDGCNIERVQNVTEGSLERAAEQRRYALAPGVRGSVEVVLDEIARAHLAKAPLD